MTFIYNIIIRFYEAAIHTASIFGNPKARFWANGRRDIFKKLATDLKAGERRIWVHAASLGEFEQGRPLIEMIKEQHPAQKIVLTFFSPSGYEIRKNYGGADYIFYLPIDTPLNARRFIDLVMPEKVLFVKYEFWYNYLSVLRKRDIPVYLCSAIFRENQLFFKWYGGWYRNILTMFRHIFVQTDKSRELLAKLGFTGVTVAGDTRFDRVYAIANQAREINEVAVFVGNSPCLVAGSTWEPDEDLLAVYINQTTLPIKYIIAPHEIHPSHIERFEKSITKKVVRYSVWKTNQHDTPDVLIIDNIGMLSSLYRYGQVAYIGGGFGKGIHNILEAATFGLPVLFGPNYHKFQEALALIEAEAAFSIQDYQGLRDKLDAFFTDSFYLSSTGNRAESFVNQNIGATEKIMAGIWS